MVAARIADMPAHRPAADKSANLRTSQTDAAEKLNVSERSVNTAKSDAAVPGLRIPFGAERNRNAGRPSVRP